MSSADKMGMIVAIGIVAAAVGFTMTGGTGEPSDIAVNVSPVMEKAKELQKEVETTVEKIKQTAEETKEFMKETKTATEKGMKMAEELVSPKSTVRLVSIPQETSIPGCEKQDLCYDPAHIIVFVGTEVTWKNNDSAVHTVTSGTIKSGPDGKFDSSLISPGSVYGHTFKEKGKNPYFCIVHPWMTGSVQVE